MTEAKSVCTLDSSSAKPVEGELIERIVAEMRIWGDRADGETICGNPYDFAGAAVAVLKPANAKALAQSNRWLREAGQELADFAWSAVTADCDEARVNLNNLVANLRAALKDNGQEGAS